jgi:aspartate aminotransferase
VFIITDDIYSGLVYDEPFVSIAHVAPDLRHRTLIASGASKTYAMTGWRVGFGVGPKKLIDAMSDLQGACTSGACSIAQAAAAEALTGPQNAVEEMRLVFKTRRDRMVAGLRSIPGVSVVSPKGAFYAFPRIDAYLGEKTPNTHALCEYLLESAHVALVPGEAFGSKHHVRLSFACSDADIDEAIARMKRGLAALQKA